MVCNIHIFLVYIISDPFWGASVEVGHCIVALSQVEYICMEMRSTLGGLELSSLVCH